MKWIVPAVMLTLILTACIFVEPDPKDAAAVTAYNKNLYELLTPLMREIVIFLGFAGLWIKSNIDKRDVREGTERAAERLALSAQERNNKVIEAVAENTAISTTAFQVANGYSEKIADLKRELAETLAAQRRAPHRATDNPEHVQKIEITKGPDEPLKTKEQR